MTPKDESVQGKRAGYNPLSGQPTAARDYRLFRPVNDLRISELLAELGKLDRVSSNIWEPFASKYAKRGSSRYQRLLESLHAAHELADTQHYKQISPTRTSAHRKLENLARISRELLAGLMPEEALPPVRRHPRAATAIPEEVKNKLPSIRIDPVQKGSLFGLVDQDIAPYLRRESANTPFKSKAASAITLEDAMRYLTALNHWLSWAAYNTPPLSPSERGAMKLKPVSVFMTELDRSVRRMRWIGRGGVAFKNDGGRPVGWRYDFLRNSEAHAVRHGLLVGPPIRRNTTELISDAHLLKILTAGVKKKS